MFLFIHVSQTYQMVFPLVKRKSFFEYIFLVCVVQGTRKGTPLVLCHLYLWGIADGWPQDCEFDSSLQSKMNYIIIRLKHQVILFYLVSNIWLHHFKLLLISPRFQPFFLKSGYNPPAMILKLVCKLACRIYSEPTHRFGAMATFAFNILHAQQCYLCHKYFSLSHIPAPCC